MATADRVRLSRKKKASSGGGTTTPTTPTTPTDPITGDPGVQVPGADPANPGYGGNVDVIYKDPLPGQDGYQDGTSAPDPTNDKSTGSNPSKNEGGPGVGDKTKPGTAVPPESAPWIFMLYANAAYALSPDNGATWYGVRAPWANAVGSASARQKIVVVEPAKVWRSNEMGREGSFQEVPGPWADDTLRQVVFGEGMWVFLGTKRVYWGADISAVQFQSMPEFRERLGCSDFQGVASLTHQDGKWYAIIGGEMAAVAIASTFTGEWTKGPGLSDDIFHPALSALSVDPHKDRLTKDATIKKYDFDTLDTIGHDSGVVLLNDPLGGARKCAGLGPAGYGDWRSINIPVSIPAEFNADIAAGKIRMVIEMDVLTPPADYGYYNDQFSFYLYSSFGSLGVAFPPGLGSWTPRYYTTDHWPPAWKRLRITHIPSAGESGFGVVLMGVLWTPNPSIAGRDGWFIDVFGADFRCWLERTSDPESALGTGWERVLSLPHDEAIITGGDGLAMFKSDDKGATYRSVRPVPRQGFGVAGMLYQAESGWTTAALMGAVAGKNILISADRGETWSAWASPFVGGAPTTFLTRTWRRLWIASGNRIAASDNGGKAWKVFPAPLPLPPVTIHEIDRYAQ